MIRSMRTILCSLPRPFAPTLPYTTLFRSLRPQHQEPAVAEPVGADARDGHAVAALGLDDDAEITSLDDPDREKVGGPESLGDGPRPRPMVELGWIADLQDAAAVDDRKAVRESERVGGVPGGVHGRHRQVAMKLRQLEAQGLAWGGVEGGEGLIE